ncbi:MAG: cytochrome d ubiquinol oxidase subunit II [Niabella sp.]
MVYVVMAFLWTSILLYIIMGGADFGAGILEFFSTKRSKLKTQKIIYEAIGPVWEANHMWLIIAIVILFVGFPNIYTLMSVHLHIPLAIMLLGIIARGTAFTFRHYDAVKDNLQTVYSKIFVYASLVTPFFLGVIAGSAVSGLINPKADNFLDAYIFCWLSPFPISVGLFTITICGFLAAIFIIGETESETEQQRFILKAKHFSIAAIACSALVLVVAELEDIPMSKWLFGNTVSLTCVALAVVSLLWMWRSLFKRTTKGLRLVAGAQVTLILVAITYEHYPVLIALKDSPGLSLLETQASEKTIHALGMALLLGSIFILPALFYLLYSFTKQTDE